MLDSDEEDSDCLSSANALNYPKQKAMIRLKGPNFETTRMCDLPRNFEKQRYCNEFADRELHDRRPTSPMSYRSTSERLPQFDRLPRREYGYSLMPPPQNAHHSFYNGGYGNGRPGSPAMSMMSMGSINSVTSDVVVSAVKSGRFDKYQLRSIIKEANNKLMKGRVRKRMTKRRNLKMFLKSACRASGGESGEHATDSSLSSDDCRSTRTGVTRYGGYRNYASSSKYLTSDRNCDDARSVRTDVTDLRKTIQEHTGYRNRSGEFEQNSFKNMFNLGPRRLNNTSIARSNYSVGPAHSTTINSTLRDRFKNSFLLPSQRFNKSTAQPILGQNVSRNYNYNTKPQNERFKSSFLLPSERFNKTSTMSHISEDRNEILLEKNTRAHSPILAPRNYRQKNTTRDIRTDSEDQCEITVLEQTAQGMARTPKSIRKRNLSSSDESLPAGNKLKKLATPEKIANKIKNTETYCNIDKNQCDFSFAKPTLPVKKLANAKVGNVKNRMPHSEVQQPINKVDDSIPNNTECAETLDASEDPSDSALYTSDMSMRPSFIKRKLFTQTLEVTESKNVSTDSSPSSPLKQKRPYTDDQNDKNKARKLVPSTSYMSREVADDSNLLDLIHKIVPPDRMNITQQKPQNKSNVKQKEIADDKWDISSIITANDVDEGSETFTNEDIFETNDSDFIVKPKKTAKKSPSKPVAQSTKSVAKITKSGAQSIKTVAQSSKPVNNTQKKCIVVMDRLNDAEYKNEHSALPSQETFGGAGPNKKPVADVAVRSVFHYANKFWNCDSSESEAPDTPDYRRNRSAPLNDTPLAGQHQKNAPQKKNMPVTKEIENLKNKASNAEKPPTKKSIPVAKEKVPVAKEKVPVAKEKVPVAKEKVPVAKEKVPVAKEKVPLPKEKNTSLIEGRPRRTRYNSTMDSSQNISTLETRSMDHNKKATNRNPKATTNKENSKPAKPNNVLKPLANKTSNNETNLNDSEKAKQYKKSKNTNKKLQDTTFTPTRQSTRIKLKYDSSNDAIESDNLKQGSNGRKPYQSRSENKENYKIDSTIVNKVSNKTLVKNSLKPERTEEPYRHIVKKVHSIRKVQSKSDTSLTPTRRSTRIQLKHDSSNESNNITRSIIYRSIQLGLRRQREV